MKQFKFVKWFKEIGIDDVGTVGGKNASLGEMFQNLIPKGIRIPNGFAITAEGYFHFLKANKLEDVILDAMSSLDTQNVDSLRERGKKIRQYFLDAKIPDDLRSEIVSAYHQLGNARSVPMDVAVRSSATAEDLPDASFAGQQETYLNVQGDQALLDSCLRCFASLFTDRAISYRHDKGFDHMKVGLSIGVQQMVRSDLAASGVMFSIDTETGFRDAVVINSSYGLGENIVQGSVNPDEYYVFKTTLKSGLKPILQKHLGNKEFKLVYDLGGSKMVKNIPVANDDRTRFSISDEDVLTLAKWACGIEDYYSKKKGHHLPMDMEWAKDGRSGELFIVQARPETVQSQKDNLKAGTILSYHLKKHSEVLLKGSSVGEKIGSGQVRVIKTAEDLGQLLQGEILVTDKTDPDWEPAMKRASAIITNRGGRTCHAAIVSRELGLPAIVGTQNATETLKSGQMVTVSCAEGETGFVYDGKLEYTIDQLDFSNLAQPKTKIMLNVGNPDEAFRLSFLPNSGVGLARMEFIISNSIKIHPLALLKFDSLKDENVKKQIEQLTLGYNNKTEFFVDKLAQGVSKIAAAFFPKDVIVRMSDFKTNEYADLVGGKPFEPHEENPMLGFRGASRYYDPKYLEGFALECRAMKKVREEMGLTNVLLMIPFCRTLDEGRKVIAEMEKNGLKRGENGLLVYVMCEIPSNVILAEEFSDIFDGFSIGSNDLTQLVLGVDRDSEIVAHVFDERNEAVEKMISMVIRSAHSKGRKIGICGQAPSDYPEFARFLVENKIDSISLNPDVVVKTTKDILNIEKAALTKEGGLPRP
ncbi:MAG: phosphoenolpyruvate synthase [Bacteriovorax sp.]|nr:phosphoenolpyruvate synthase [Bacteriovorax sp.]